MQLRWQSARLACERYGDRYPASPLFLCFLIFLVSPLGPKMKKFTSPLMVQLKIFKWAWAFNQFQCKPVFNSPSFMLCPHFNNHAHNFFPLKLLGISYYLLFIINLKQTKNFFILSCTFSRGMHGTLLIIILFHYKSCFPPFVHLPSFSRENNSYTSFVQSRRGKLRRQKEFEG